MRLFYDFQTLCYVVESLICIYTVFSEPPSPPLISGLPQNQTLREGQPLSLTCSTTDGSPQPRLAWYMDESLQELSHANLTLNPFSQSQLRLVASRQDNNREYR